MCGIVGAIGNGSQEFIELSLESLHHRGPDSKGTFHSGKGLSMGATRLAMTDPDPRSNQPMTDLINKNVIVFNGEIYNFRSLRKNLSAKGIFFTTESDTEVIMKAISEFGIDYIKFFEGMFAFGFYNHSENSIVLARDYLGKKPLFYAIGKDFFIFSSKISLVKKFLKFVSIDNLSLSNYLKYGYTINPQTMFKEINSVKPGEIIKINLNTVEISFKTQFTPFAIMEPSELGIVETFEEALSQRTSGHKSFAISMSGGVDSTIIAIMAAKQGLNCKAYSMRWKDSDKSRYNEDAKAAKLICEKLGLEFESVNMPDLNNLPNELDKFINAMEEPNANPSGLSMMALYNQIQSDGHRLVLTGDGSDEIFGGYSRYEKINKFNWIPKFSLTKSASLHLNMELRNKHLRRLALVLSSGQNIEYWSYWQQLATDAFLRRIYSRYEVPDFDIEKDDFFKFLINNKSTVALTMGRDLRIWLAMESNSKLDRVSMAHSIEARSPFQSEKIIGKGFKEMSNSDFRLINKQLLKRSFPELTNLPINKEKMGFISPLGHWLRNNKDLVFDSVHYLQNNLDFNSVELEKLSKTPELGVYEDFRFLWTLIVLAKWHNYAFN